MSAWQLCSLCHKPAPGTLGGIRILRHQDRKLQDCPRWGKLRPAVVGLQRPLIVTPTSLLPAHAHAHPMAVGIHAMNTPRTYPASHKHLNDSGKGWEQGVKWTRAWTTGIYVISGNRAGSLTSGERSSSSERRPLRGEPMEELLASWPRFVSCGDITVVASVSLQGAAEASLPARSHTPCSIVNAPQKTSRITAAGGTLEKAPKLSRRWHRHCDNFKGCGQLKETTASC